MLLHIIDLSSADAEELARQAVAIVNELAEFDNDLASRPRWLVFNKIDAVPEEERDAKVQQVMQILDWKDKHFLISAVSKSGTKELCYAVMDSIG